MKKIWSEGLTVLALCFLVAYSYPAFKLNMSTSEQVTIEVVQWVCWFAFASDLIYGFWKASDRKYYLKHHPLEIVAVFLPFFRPLRLMRVISFGSLAIQKIAVGRQLAITLKVFISTFFIAYISAIQITVIERNVPGSNIKDIGDGLWWAFTTLTVAYGDTYPTTTQGRFLSLLIITMGVSLIGVITASIASWFVEISKNNFPTVSDHKKQDLETYLVTNITSLKLDPTKAMAYN